MAGMDSWLVNPISDFVHMLPDVCVGLEILENIVGICVLPDDSIPKLIYVVRDKSISHILLPV